MTQRYAHLSPKYMAGTVGKLDSVLGAVMPKDNPSEAQYVTIASPDCGSLEGTSPKLLIDQVWRPQGDSNPRYRRERAMS
jgi:hypothetical protein